MEQPVHSHPLDRSHGREGNYWLWEVGRGPDDPSPRSVKLLGKGHSVELHTNAFYMESADTGDRFPAYFVDVETARKVAQLLTASLAHDHA